MVVYEDGIERRLSDGRGRDCAGSFAQLEVGTSDRDWMLAQAAERQRKRKSGDRAAWVSTVLAYFSRR